MTATVKIDNDYEDGISVSVTVDVEAPTGDIDDWWDNEIFQLTGTGRDSNIAACYTAKILTADNPALIGLEREWC